MIVTVLFVLFMFKTAYAEDEIETLDGSLFKGKIVKEDNKSVYLKIKTGTVLIDRDMIKSVRMSQSWDIEDHVERLDKTSANVTAKKNPEPQSHSIIYFPLKMGSWWKYNVRYTPQNLYGEHLTEKSSAYVTTWEITDQTRTNTLYFSQYAWHLPDIYQLTISRDDVTGQPTRKMLFVGSLEGEADKAFLVMVDQNRKDSFFYQRILPKNPFLKYTSQWTDIGQESKATFKSASKIIGVEGIDTACGYFEDCLVIERVDKVENQTLQSRVYFWYAPDVGMVKMIHEIVYPQVESGKMLKTYSFQEYDLIAYGVK
ncbi:MAG: hypothetical protein RBU23_06795 [Candidatus Auribacterota bacterium]|nr:hypothetical protein [Candidatus Auribacterota bacterium]